MYREVPFWVIVNPASGPGEAVDANYTKAIDRLIGAGCVVLGYVPTDYGRAPFEQVEKICRRGGGCTRELTECFLMR